ncbi:arsenate reductase ArsC [Spirochaeta cellobiosiphila]|uniref:arsenate reductase ArsC n=1 Tax=Spirochaeta cellobiosiphila TaxID=504483 RepID=UPI000400FBFE|nr:arsenate reductase ArsC [Spirochaeta cellobiosiphila]
MEPGNINPYVIEALKLEGIDVTQKQTKSVMDLFKAERQYDYVITVCSRDVEEKCPVFPGTMKRMNWPFPDPEKFQGSKEEILQQVIELKDVIGEMIKQFIEAKTK